MARITRMKVLTGEREGRKGSLSGGVREDFWCNFAQRAGRGTGFVRYCGSRCSQQKWDCETCSGSVLTDGCYRLNPGVNVLIGGRLECGQDAFRVQCECKVAQRNCSVTDDELICVVQAIKERFEAKRKVFAKQGVHAEDLGHVNPA